MATETPTDEGAAGRAGVRTRAKWYALGYPVFWLGVVFVIPMALLFIVSFWVNIPGGSYRAGATLENYTRFLTSRLYLGQLWLTIEISLVTAIISLLMGYPIAYYLARMERAWLRNLLLLTIISSLWVTYVIRAYAWQVILASGGILSSTGVALGILAEARSFYPGYWALVVGMVYVFLPFMILTLYTSIRNIDDDLLAASKNLGAGPTTTFRRVTLPLSKNGIISGTALVFILGLGSYLLPRLLGGAPERTLPVLIEQQIINEQNYPFGAAMSIGLIVVVIVFLWLVLKFTNVSAASLGGTEGIDSLDGSDGDEHDRPANVSPDSPTADSKRLLVSPIPGLSSVRRVLTRGLDRLLSVTTVVDARQRERAIRYGTGGFVALVMAFIAVPLAIVMAVSVTPERFLTFPPGGFSLQWYVEVFTDTSWLEAIVTSLVIATGAAILSTTIGGTLAFALDRYDYRLRDVFGAFGILPILIPPVIFGVAFLIFFLRIGLQGSVLGIIIAHGIFYAPFPFILIAQGLDELERTYEEAAMNLGASPLKTIRTITYPLLQANVVAGAMFAFILSLNEYIIAWLLSFFLVSTIPIQIFTQLRYGYSPSIAAASVVLIAITVVAMVVIDRLSGGIWG